jgi:hypothetical protein
MDAHPALQLKEEIMDLDFPGLDADARKKRRNRTTQSCLNCHTSKRKCESAPAHVMQILLRLMSHPQAIASDPARGASSSAWYGPSAPCHRRSCH